MAWQPADPETIDTSIIGWAVCEPTGDGSTWRFRAGHGGLLRNQDRDADAAIRGEERCSQWWNAQISDINNLGEFGFNWKLGANDTTKETEGYPAARDFLLTMHGQKSGTGGEIGIMYLFSAIAMFASFGLIALGIFMAKIMMAFLILRLFFALLKGLGPKADIGAELGKVGKQLIGLSALTVGAMVIFSGFGLMVTVMNKMILAMVQPGTMAAMFWQGLVPIGVIVGLSMAFKKMGLPNPMSIKGAMAWGGAAGMAGGAAGAALGNRMGAGRRAMERAGTDAARDIGGQALNKLSGGRLGHGAAEGGRYDRKPSGPKEQGSEQEAFEGNPPLGGSDAAPADSTQGATPIDPGATPNPIDPGKGGPGTEGATPLGEGVDIEGVVGGTSELTPEVYQALPLSEQVQHDGGWALGEAREKEALVAAGLAGADKRTQDNYIDGLHAERKAAYATQLAEAKRHSRAEEMSEKPNSLRARAYEIARKRTEAGLGEGESMIDADGRHARSVKVTASDRLALARESAENGRSAAVNGLSTARSAAARGYGDLKAHPVKTIRSAATGIAAAYGSTKEAVTAGGKTLGQKAGTVGRGALTVAKVGGKVAGRTVVAGALFAVPVAGPVVGAAYSAKHIKNGAKQASTFVKGRKDLKDRSDKELMDRYSKHLESLKKSAAGPQQDAPIQDAQPSPGGSGDRPTGKEG